MATAYVRIIAAKDVTSTNLGTYDLRLSANFNLHDGMNVTKNPVFSYRSDGKLYIFSADDQLSNCSYLNEDKFELWEWSFSCTTSQLSAFRAHLQEIVNTYSWNSTTGRYVCSLKSPYNNFEMGERDSFISVATWCELLGNATLMNRVEENNAYQATLPAALEEKYTKLGKWVKIADGHDLP